jgi:excinuclease ABC subunit A
MELPDNVQNVILRGSGSEEIKFKIDIHSRREVYKDTFLGVIPFLENKYRGTGSDWIRDEIEKYMNLSPCPACNGSRLRNESLSIKINDSSIFDVTNMSVKECVKLLNNLKLTKKERFIANRLLKEIVNRLEFLNNVGLSYLTLERSSASLSGGEGQRIRLATQIGSALTGVLYVLDEPSIGLHPRDTSKLISTLTELRDIGNTVLVTEHDRDTIRSADHVIDIGPGAGVHGGEIVAQGTPAKIMSSRKSLTGKFLSGRETIELPVGRRFKGSEMLAIKGASEHNLKHIDVEIPIGVLCCITGVSGSGKSTLINETLYPALMQRLYHSKIRAGKVDAIDGLENLDKVINIDQSPIGRTPRSNPATYTGVFTHIRDIFSQLPASKTKGYKAGRFSFNVKGGRCEACEGDGIIKIEMHFMPDVYVECEVCNGRRFNRETLEIQYKGASIADILSKTINQSYKFFENIPAIRHKLKTLIDVGLGYLELGQSATTLSGGEAQRIKLSRELSKRSTGRTLYILDEPTTGLHFADVQKLLYVLNKLVDAGNTVVVIEHNLDVIKCSDYIIDLGPDGGDAGGHVVATGTPENIVKNKKSYTAKYLKDVIKKEK